MKRLTILCSTCVFLGLLLGIVLTNNRYHNALISSEAYAVQPSATAGNAAGNWAEQAPDLKPLTQEEQINVNVYERSNPSVVNINTRSVMVDHFFGMRREAAGMGSGMIYDKQGHILTNFHVVEGANDIEVTTSSNQTFKAALVGSDKEHDVAVLRIDAAPEVLQPISLGRSDNLRVGQRVYVLGNPFSWDGTLTTGIISSLNRDLPGRVDGRPMKSLIQTDAAMNPGNSGGPMLDTNSDMIGMCVAIATKTGQNSGVGFAIPIDRIKQIVPQLIQNGRIVHANIGISQVMETQSGLVVVSLDPDGPAAQAGIQGFRRIVQRRQQGPVIYETETIDRTSADRILAVDGEPMKTGVRFRDKIWEYKPGESVDLTVIRDGKEQVIAVTLGSD